MTAHTPGPWLYRPKNDGVYTAPPEGTSYSYGELIFAFNEDFSPPSSDLPLILAAPDLLDALTALLPIFEEWHKEVPHEVGDNEAPALAAAIAAIAKAKGESDGR